MSSGICCESEANALDVEMGHDVMYPGLSFPTNCLYFSRFNASLNYKQWLTYILFKNYFDDLFVIFF